MKPLFQLRQDAEIDQVTGQLEVLGAQMKAVNDSLFELTCEPGKLHLHAEEISGLVTQHWDSINQLQQMARFLNDKILQEVQNSE